MDPINIVAREEYEGQILISKFVRLIRESLLSTAADGRAQNGAQAALKTVSAEDRAMVAGLRRQLQELSVVPARGALCADPPARRVARRAYRSV